MKYLIILALALSLLSCNDSSHQRTERVILIGLDGFSTDGLQIASTPNLDRLIQEGALSLQTRGVMPTVSAPNWGSMLSGAGPEQHGMTYNGWTTDNHTVKPQVSDEDGYFPSIFNVLKKADPNIKTGIFYQWSGLTDIYNHKFMDKSEHDELENNGHITSMNKASDFIINDKGDFTFLYILEIDHVGHHDGHYTPEYYRAVQSVDSLLGIFFDKLKKAEMYDNSHIIIISDHGGVGKGHGGLSMAEIEVPWIIRGPGIISNKIIEQPNNNFNTASTIAYLFEIEQPYAWIGKPVYGAFESDRLSRDNTRSYVPIPKVALNSGLFSEPQLLKASTTANEITIRYTLDGSEPTESSTEYAKPVQISQSSKINIASFKDGFRSKIVSKNVALIKEIESLELAHSPSSQYDAEGPLSLVDKNLAADSHSDTRWLGFEGHDLVATIALGDSKSVKNLKIRCLVSEGVWIFGPKSFTLTTNDVKTYSPSALNPKKEGSIVTYTIPVNKEIDKFSLTVENTAVCPEGHAGAGESAWLFVDEIFIE